ncbi:MULTISPECIES: ferritin-like domain-containing protein [Arthrobacter]|uniref:DUF4439 domain-containing protein n=1 Tax=Arthrobacter oryzae TaxID=409290 RepID=A0A3N0C5X7_9MICC|nr:MULTISPECIES: ferritin-like domain-containing protein [Arthrobacter]QYF90779.1 ferritin-like domain-containing protein [Arthrobacter sp. PAMC25284]RNL57571.1 DUF4439 domain-containing protein [Arthrobacter oryzae]
MTTWSVVKDDTREKRWHGLFPRRLSLIALLACLALVVFGLGVAVAPRQAVEAPEPPFSEQARAAALANTLRLRDAGGRLGRAAAGTEEPAADTLPDAQQSAVDETVRLLTTQARALLAPGGGAARTPLSGTSTPIPPTNAEDATGSAAGLAAALAESGGQRLADAAASDGGIARLLAAVGTAQLLQSASLAAADGAAAPPQAVPHAPQPSETCPPGSPTPSSTAAPEADEGTGNPSLQAGLAATVRTEAATVYAYQVALTRLEGDAARSASGYLAQHEALLRTSESLSRALCSPVPPREAGYTLAPGFLDAPAPGLGVLETTMLPGYGDVIALSTGETRQWAIAALLETARRAVSWGADAGALPGVAADPATFPSLPAQP